MQSSETSFLMDQQDLGAPVVFPAGLEMVARGLRECKAQALQLSCGPSQECFSAGRDVEDGYTSQVSGNHSFPRVSQKEGTLGDLFSPGGDSTCCLPLETRHDPVTGSETSKSAEGESEGSQADPWPKPHWPHDTSCNVQWAIVGLGVGSRPPWGHPITSTTSGSGRG